MKQLDSGVFIDTNPRLKTDFVNDKGVNVSRFYREIDNSVPRCFSDLAVGGEINFKRNPFGMGYFANYFKISAGEGIKVLAKRNDLDNPYLSFDKIRRETVNQKTGLALGVNLPKNSELCLFYDLNSKTNYPVLKMEHLEGRVLRKLKRHNFWEDIVLKFDEQKELILGYLSEKGLADVNYNNAIFDISSVDNPVRIYDTALWEFKGVRDLK